MNCRDNSKLTFHTDKRRQEAATGSISGIVDAYLADHRDPARRELRYYARQRTLAQAIEKAALSKLPSGKRHPHQRRIARVTLAKVARLLARENFLSATNFDDLHALVNGTIGPIRGIGPLAVYDIAHRIGAYLDHAPEQIYFHRGALVGARALGLRGNVVQMNDLPKAFRRLTPAEVEDCLCIYKDHLKRLKARHD